LQIKQADSFLAIYGRESRHGIQALTLVQPPSKLIPSLPDIAMEVGTYLTKGMYPLHTTDDRGDLSSWSDD